MQLISRKTVRTVLAAGGATLALAAGASAAAAATTVQNYSGGWVTTASGTSVGIPANSALPSAVTLTLPEGNASCTKGSLAGALGTNPGSTVPLGLTAFGASTCTDTIGAYDISSIVLDAPGGDAIIAGTSASGGTLTISNSTTFRLNVRLTSGLSIPCNMRPTTAAGANTTAVGTLSNPTGTPPGANGKATFSDVAFKSSNAAGDTCSLIINGSGSPATYTRFSGTFNNLQVLSNGTKLRVIGP